MQIWGQRHKACRDPRSLKKTTGKAVFTLTECSFVDLFLSCFVWFTYQSSRSQNVKMRHKEGMIFYPSLFCCAFSCLLPDLQSLTLCVYLRGGKEKSTGLSWSGWQCVVRLWCRKCRQILHLWPVTASISAPHLRSLSLITNVLLLVQWWWSFMMSLKFKSYSEGGAFETVWKKKVNFIFKGCWKAYRATESWWILSMEHFFQSIRLHGPSALFLLAVWLASIKQAMWCKNVFFSNCSGWASIRTL